MRKFFFIALFILAFAFILRVINLTILPVFADEAIYIRWSQVMRAEQNLRFLPLSDGKQPLFMWTVIPFLKIISDPLFAGRFVSVLSGMGTLIGVMILSYVLFKSKRASAISGVIYAVSPFAFFFDRLALADSMLSMFGIWTVIFTILAIRYTRFDSAMLAGFSLGGAALTKSPALFVALLLPLTVLTKTFPKKKQKQLLEVGKVTVVWGITFVLASAIYNILRLGPNFHMIGSRNLDYVYPLSHILENPLDPFLPHLDRAFQWIRMLGSDLLIVLVMLGVLFQFKKYRNHILFLLALSLAPILIQSMYAKVFTARYIFFTMPYLYILAGASFVTLYRSKWRWFVYGVFTTLLLHSMWFNALLLSAPERAPLPRSERSGYLEEWTAGTGIKESADYILKRHAENPNQPIVIGTEGYFGTLPDGLQIYLEKVPNVTVIGVGLGINEIPQQLKEAVQAGSEAYLLANTSRLNFDKSYEMYGLELVYQFRKADRPEGIREYIEHGPFDYVYLFRVTPNMVR